MKNMQEIALKLNEMPIHRNTMRVAHYSEVKQKLDSLTRNTALNVAKAMVQVYEKMKIQDEKVSTANKSHKVRKVIEEKGAFDEA
jgi:cytochrome b involved in lipid metabolism